VASGADPIERHVRVHRTARFFQLGGVGEGPETREIWLACHGYGQLAAPFARALAPLNDGTRVVVAPEGLSRFYLDDPMKRHGPDSPVGASWMTREDRESEITDYVEYLDTIVSQIQRELATPGARVVALGFSQGVATASRWAVFGHTKIDRLILWGGAIPKDLPADRGVKLFRDASLTLVAGRADRLVPVDAIVREQRELEQRGIPSALLLHEGGHALSSEALRELAAATSSGA
jgi:predicted esterase